jgi:hypothetical protein
MRGGLMIDIEEELKKTLIKYIQKELEQLQFYYSDITDLGFLHILCGYKEMLELAVTTDDMLLLYKKMYQDSLNYLFEANQSTSMEADFVCEECKNTESYKKDNNFYSYILLKDIY